MHKANPSSNENCQYNDRVQSLFWHLDPHEGGCSDWDTVLVLDHTTRGAVGTQINDFKLVIGLVGSWLGLELG